MFKRLVIIIVIDIVIDSFQQSPYSYAQMDPKQILTFDRQGKYIGLH